MMMQPPTGPFATHGGPGGQSMGPFASYGNPSQSGMYPQGAPLGQIPSGAGMSMMSMSGPPSMRLPPGSGPPLAPGPMQSLQCGQYPPHGPGPGMGALGPGGPGGPLGPMHSQPCGGPPSMQGSAASLGPGPGLQGPLGQGPPPPEPQQENIVPIWYPAENNWQLCLDKMAYDYQQVLAEFSGEWSDEQRRLKETRMEQAAEMMYEQSGGKFGKQYQPKTRTAHVVDIFQDWRFPGDNTSWYRGGESADFHDLKAPAVWKRLQEFSMDIPYPVPNAVSGNFNPHGGRIYQGMLADFYLAAGMQIISMRPQLIADIFVGMKFSSPRMGIYTLRLYKHGQWHDVQVDDALPFDGQFNALCCTGEFFPDMAWPSLVEKAYAKLHGSWEGLSGGGHVEEVLTDLTGGCASRFGTTDVAADRLWQYLKEMMPWCVFGCNINEAECSKRQVPIEKHWASAIWRVEKHDGIPYVCVCTAAPTATVRHLPFCDVPTAEGYGVHDGFAWLRIDDFIAFFDTVYECRLVNTDLPGLQVSGIPCSPGYIAGYPWYEEMWAFQGDVYGETAPSFLMEVLDVPNVITIEVSQTDVRYSDPHNDKEFGRGMQAPLLLRFYQCSREVSDQGGGEIYLAHLSAWGHARDACCGVKVLRPGKFLAMVSIPAKYTCNKMIFRTYSTRPLAMKPITSHRSWISANPARPLDAIPYSLAGFQRVDAYSERLPQMFDEAEGRGKPMANAQEGSLRGRGMPAWQQRAAERLDRAGLGGRKGDGLKVVGSFGGRDAVATVEASEVQEGCSVS